MKRSPVGSRTSRSAASRSTGSTETSSRAEGHADRATGPSHSGWYVCPISRLSRQSSLNSGLGTAESEGEPLRDGDARGPGSDLHVLRREAHQRSDLLLQVRASNPMGDPRRPGPLGAWSVGDLTAKRTGPAPAGV